MGDFLFSIQREKKALGSVFFVSRAIARDSESPQRAPQQLWCQKNATFSSCPFWYISTQSLTENNIMMKLTLSALELNQLKTTFKTTADPRLHHRCQAILMAARGRRHSHIAEDLAVSPRTV